MKVGLLGYGLAGEVFHAPLIAATDGLELATIVTGNPERAARATARYPEAAVGPDNDAVWDNDLVVIATPNRFHLPLAHEALARGVAAVVDKPLATSLAEVNALLAAAEGKQLTVFQNRRWDGDFLTALELDAAGALGLTRLTSRFVRFRPEVQKGWREAGDPRGGGGQLLDLGSHLIDQALLLFGPARTVYAELETQRPGGAIEDDVFIAIEHWSGARSHLFMSAVAPIPSARLEVSGPGGGFVSQDLDVQETQLRDGLSPTAPEFGVNPPGLLIDAAGTREQPVQRGDYAQFYAMIPPWLRGDAPPPVDPLDSRKLFTVIEAARQSAATATVVSLER